MSGATRWRRGASARDGATRGGPARRARAAWGALARWLSRAAPRRGVAGLDTPGAGPRTPPRVAVAGGVLRAAGLAPLATMGLGAAALLGGLWARLGVAAPPWGAVGAAVFAAVLARAIAGLAAWADPAADVGLLGLLAGGAIVVAGGAWRPGAAPAVAAAVVVVWGAWWQAGRLGADLSAADSPVPAPDDRMRAEEVAAARGRSRAEAEPGERVREAVAGWVLLSGALVGLVPSRPGVRGHPLLLAAGMAALLLGGAAAVAEAMRRGLRRRARLEGADARPELESVGLRTAMGAAALAVLAAAALPAPPALLARPFETLVTGVASGLTRALFPAATGAGAEVPPPVTVPPPGPPPWITPLILGLAGLAALVAVAFLVSGLVRLARSRAPERGLPAGGLGAAVAELLHRLWLALGDLLAALLAGSIWRQVWTSLAEAFAVGKRAVRGGGSAALRPAAGAPSRRTAPRPRTLRGDSRARVRAAYRRVLAAAASRGHGRAPATTPRRYAAFLGRVLRRGGPDQHALTGLYEEARYSAHDLPEGAAAAAAAFAAAVLADLERSGGALAAGPAGTPGRPAGTATAAAPADRPQPPGRA